MLADGLSHGLKKLTTDSEVLQGLVAASAVAGVPRICLAVLAIQTDNEKKVNVLLVFLPSCSDRG